MKRVQSPQWTRRQMLQSVTAGMAASMVGQPFVEHLLGETLPAKRSKPKVAAIISSFHYLSHAYHILLPFQVPYLFNGKIHQPQCEIVSVYVDQFSGNDISRDVCKKYNIPIYDTIAGAVRNGGTELAVDAVLSIGEHGDYPENDRHQTMYPRKRFFDAIVKVMQQSQRYVPIFNDKHLSYRWDWAKEMYDTSREHHFPLMAGSSVPLAQRIPDLEIQSGTEIDAAIAIHGGPVEKFDIHGLEVLQSLVELRKGGETGIAAIQLLKGDELLRAGKAGRWSIPLAEAAMQAELGKQKRGLFDNIGNEEQVEPHGILIEYRDGFRATVLRVGKSGVRWNFAYQQHGNPQLQATRFYAGPWGNRNLFRAFSHAIQSFFLSRNEPYACERTLLTTGALDAAMSSLVAQGKQIKTPQLNISYKPNDMQAFREMGDSWKILSKYKPPTTFSHPEADDLKNK